MTGPRWGWQLDIDSRDTVSDINKVSHSSVYFSKCSVLTLQFLFPAKLSTIQSSYYLLPSKKLSFCFLLNKFQCCYVQRLCSRVSTPSSF